MKWSLNHGCHSEKVILHLLCKPDPVQYEAAVKGTAAEVETCKAALAYAQSNFGRINLLCRKQASSLDTMEDTRFPLGSARAMLMSAEVADIRRLLGMALSPRRKMHCRAGQLSSLVYADGCGDPQADLGGAPQRFQRDFLPCFFCRRNP